MEITYLLPEITENSDKYYKLYFVKMPTVQSKQLLSTAFINVFTLYRGCIYDCSNAVYSFQIAYHSNTYRIFVTTAKPSKTLVGTNAEKEIVVKSSCIITNSLVHSMFGVVLFRISR